MNVSTPDQDPRSPLTSPPVPPAAAGRRNVVPFWEKVAVGCGAMADYFGNSGVKATAVPFYQMILGVNPALLGIALAVPRLWDAITDPLMGNLSDNFRSRWGRRRPFIVAGAILSGILFGSIWMVPTTWGETGQLAWFMVTSLLFFTAFTVFTVPYRALTLEMTPDYDERTAVMAHGTFWGRIAEMSYQWIIPVGSLAIFASLISGTRWVCWFIAVVLIAGFGVLPGIFGKERYYKVQRQGGARVPFWRSIGDSLRHRAFLVLVGLTLLKIMAGMIGSSLDYYLLVYYMFDGDIAEGSIWKGILSSAYAIFAIVGIPLVGWYTRITSKLRLVQTVYVIFIVKSIVRWFLFTPGNHGLIWIDALLGSFFSIAIAMVMPSMMADVCDDDEHRCGYRREGMFSSVFSWIVKMATSLSFLIGGVALTMVNFDSALGGNQTPETFFQMRLTLLLSGIVPAVLALLFIRYYPITRASAERVRAELEARRGTV